MTVASISDAQRDLSALIERVDNGETVTIVEGGKPVACLAAPPASREISDQEWFERWEKAGLKIRRGKGAGPDPLILSPPPKAMNGESIVDVLIEERRSGR